VILKTEEDLKGLVIEKVLPGSPAEKAGLLPDDQLIAVEGKEMTRVKDIHHALEQKGWGNDITFTITREGKEKEITVRLPPLED
jgi:S1-C subfamily serine protease